MKPLVLLLLICGLMACTEEPSTSPAVVRANAEQTPIETSPAQEELLDVETSVPDEVTTPTEMEETEAKSTLPVQQPSEVQAPKKEAIRQEVTVAPKRARRAAYPEITFKSTLWNFGELDEGDVVDHKFEFTNTGDAPLEIISTSATCGCTKPLYPFLPIQPGDKGHISVRYNSKGKFGTQKPKVTVVANTKEKTHTLYLEGKVKTEVVRH